MSSLLSTLESSPDFLLPVTAVAAWLLLVLFVAWLVHSSEKRNPESVRKIVHIGTGNVILLAWWFNIPASVGIIASILASAVTLLSYRYPLLPGINSVGRRSLGTFFYSVSIGVLVAWFWYLQQPQFAALGILVMTWGDGLAALIGQRFGKHRYKVFGGEKSWEGSLTMTVVSYLISFLIFLGVNTNLWPACWISLIVSVVATILETVSFIGIDNLTVPLGSAAVAFFLSQLLQG